MSEIFKDPIGFVRLVAFYVRQGWGVWRASHRQPQERRDHKRYDAMLKKDMSKGLRK